MKKLSNRTLGAFEKTFWLLDQLDSKDFAVAGEIEGLASVADWQQAINMVQERHPNLRARIVLDNFSRPILHYDVVAAIPLRVVHVDTDYRWEQEVEKELAIRFNTAEGPLLRAVLLQKLTDTVLILVANHTLSDGSSLMYLFRDILSALSGRPLPLMDIQQSNDETLGMADEPALFNTEQSITIQREPSKLRPKVSSIRLPEATTRKLMERSKLEQTSVHGAICAAVLTNCRRMRAEWAYKRIELISPICSRKVLALDGNYGLNITTHPVYFEGEQQLSFWEIAKLAKDGLAKTGTNAHVQGYINFFRELTFNKADLEPTMEALKGAFTQEIMVTNLTKLKYDSDFRRFKLKSLYGPMVRSGKGPEQTIGAITSNGALCLTNTSEQPIEGLLKEIERSLVEACESQVEVFVKTLK